MPPVNAKQEKEIRAILDEEIANFIEEEKANPDSSISFSVQPPPIALKRTSNNVSWKKKLSIDPTVRNFDDSEERFIWNNKHTEEFIPKEMIQKLTEQLKLILPVLTDEQEFKFLQLKLIIDCLDNLISDCRKLRQSITM